jgi:hypothetical protein
LPHFSDNPTPRNIFANSLPEGITTRRSSQHKWMNALIAQMCFEYRWLLGQLWIPPSGTHEWRICHQLVGVGIDGLKPPASDEPRYWVYCDNLGTPKSFAWPAQDRYF